MRNLAVGLLVAVAASLTIAPPARAQDDIFQIWELALDIIPTSGAPPIPSSPSGIGVPASGVATFSDEQSFVIGPCTVRSAFTAEYVFTASLNIRIAVTVTSTPASDPSCVNYSAVFSSQPGAPLDRPFPNATRTTGPGTISFTFNDEVSPAGTFTAVCRSGCGLPVAATVTSVSGAVQVLVQGTPVALEAGSSIGKGAELTTGADGQLQAACSGGARLSVRPNSAVFFDDSLCERSQSGMIDVTRGEVSLAGSAPTTAVRGADTGMASGVRTPVSQAVIASAGTTFTTSYTQVGQIGTATTSVETGSVEVLDSSAGATTVAAAGTQVVTIGSPPVIVGAVLPSSRSVQVGVPATVFATMINAGSGPAIACKITRLTPVPADLRFQRTDAATNQVAGPPNTPISISHGNNQSFVLSFTPTDSFAPTDVQMGFTCGGTQAAIVPGLNTLLLSASTTPVPDIVALAATTGGGILGLAGSGRSGAFAVATVNVGVAARITASADTGAAQLPLALAVCRTDPSSGSCIGDVGVSVTTDIPAGATPTFAVFASASGPVPFDPATNRIFVRFRDDARVTRGSTSVAVRSE